MVDNGVDAGFEHGQWSGLGEAMMKGAIPNPDFMTMYLNGATFGMTKGLGKLLAATIANIDFSAFNSDKPEDIIDFIARKV